MEGRWPTHNGIRNCAQSGYPLGRRPYRDERVFGQGRRDYDDTMPYDLKRFQKAEALHFITFSCFHRLPFLEEPEPKETFEAVLEQTRARHQARVYAYVLMPEHIHLLINEPPLILVAQFLKALKQITSRKLRGNRPQFWQDRYFDSNIHGETARSEVIRYIHRNPRGPRRTNFVRWGESRSNGDWSHRPSSTGGAASTTTPPEFEEPLKSSRSGRQEFATHSSR
jgi:putative transposase